MKLAFQLAYRNLIRAGLRTWLNVGVLSFTFIVIVFYKGFLEGWNEQAVNDAIDWEYGQGQVLNKNYDRYDPFTIVDAHDRIPESLTGEIPIFIRQGSIYPDGRMLAILIKGIDATQQALKLPTHLLLESEADYPILIGNRMAESANLKSGDVVLLRWRDKNGTYDALHVTVAGIFNSKVPSIDNGQIWMSIQKVWEMTGSTNHSTMFIVKEENFQKQTEGWRFESRDELLKELREIIEMEKISGMVLYSILLSIALLAIFDTQVLSIFRRQREIGTFIALGMTRVQVVGLFTIEGSMYSLLATILGGILGAPLFMYVANTGISVADGMDDMGVGFAGNIYPVFGFNLVMGTIILVVISSTIVSFLPSRKITKMDPVHALKGKLQ
ncbi:MAG: FtsX-like permease family protein [Cyclobacteriaceae bacterium]